MTAIVNNDAATDEDFLGRVTDEDSAAEELLRRFLPPTDAKEPSAAKEETKAPKTQETGDEDGSAEKPETEDAADDDEGDEDAEDEGQEAETVFKIKVGDVEEEVKASELTRLWGQEKALTQKSMEVAEKRRQYEADLTRLTATNGALLERARARFQPYAKLDFNLLAVQMKPEEYTALRQAATEAWEDVKFLEQDQGAFMQAIQKKQQDDLVEQARDCIKTLEGPADKGGIEGWSEKVYDEVRAFAIKEGAPAEVINQLVYPWAIKMIHSAMLYARGKDKTQVKTVKVNKTPKRIVKTTNSPEAEKRSSPSKGSATVKKAMAKLAETGSQDDAVAAIMARWEKDSDD